MNPSIPLTTTIAGASKDAGARRSGLACDEPGNTARLRRMGFVLAAAMAFAGQASAQAPVKWSVEARRDIDAIHDTIRDNHPGPVNKADPSFNRWLEEGRKRALAAAATASSSGDYWRALKLYTNGFQDGHLLVLPMQDVHVSWPGFLSSSDMAGVTRVTVSQVPQVPKGARVLSCDAQPVDRLLNQWVYPYRANAGIPHSRMAASVRLFVSYSDDQAAQFRQCRIEVDHKVSSIKLDWRPLRDEDFDPFLDAARGLETPELGVREVDGVWFVSVPTLNLGKGMEPLIAALEKKVSTLHAAPYVVLDVRGNGGGNSDWGRQIASALWGETATSAIDNSFDWTTDWRASAQNAAIEREDGQYNADQGYKDQAQYRFSVADGIETALKAKHDYYRSSAPPTSKGLSAGFKSPFAGQVYFLTDDRCASACLDLADIVTRMPGVVHVGMPTSADTIYIDNVPAKLPSGQAQLSYSLKVYRNRVRGNNQWYTPAKQWPGGPMTDAAVAAWVKGMQSNATHGAKVPNTELAFGSGSLSYYTDTGSIVLSRDDRQAKAEITHDGDLLIDGKTVVVTPEQRSMLQEYRRLAADMGKQGIKIGARGAEVAQVAVWEALKSVFTSLGGEVEKGIDTEFARIETSVVELCDRLPRLMALQQQLKASLPAFAPYAALSQDDIDECRQDAEL
ncbi:hypothetical protein GCM10027431_15380 [Lysobacter rhizosphaerae]